MIDVSYFRNASCCGYALGLYTVSTPLGDMHSLQL